MTSRNELAVIHYCHRWWPALVVLAAALALPATHAAVSIDQAPLTVQKPLAPNIVLMLDDSGSMAWDFMPDWGYLRDNSDDGVRDSDINGTYYNPDVVYGPPPEAASSGDYSPGWSDGEHPMQTAYVDGFDHDKGTVNIPGPSGKHDNGYSSPDQKFPYYTEIEGTKPGSKTKNPTPGCKPGDTLVDERWSSHNGQCKTQGNDGYYSPHKYRGWGWYKVTHRTYCKVHDQINDPYDTAKQQCVAATISYYDPSTDYPGCPRRYVYEAGDSLCHIIEKTTAYLFTYTTKNTTSTGQTYVHHYVGKSQSDCGIALDYDQNHDRPDSTCDADLSTRENVANWFAYYRTRMLLAKSGLMAAFSTLSPTTRFGFGSINHNNNDGLPKPTYGSVLAKVAPFGDGASGSQRASLWSWLVGEKPNGSTPLRQALDNVGKYYKTQQPWQNGSADTTELACRQAYTILTTDGFWNGNGPSKSPGNADGTFTSIVGANGAEYSYSPAPPYSDSYSDTLADVAMKYWVNDLRPTVANEVPPSSEDPAFWQHMTTFTLGMGFLPVNISGTASDGSHDGTYTCSGRHRNSTCSLDDTSAATIQTFMQNIFDWVNGSGSTISGFAWPRPAGSGGNGGNINNIADLAHAAVNGHGGFYSATNPQSFVGGIADALTRIAERVGTGASLAANSTKLQTGTTTYQALYYTGAWKGDLAAFTVDPDNGAIATHSTWIASKALPAWGSRNVWTYNPVSGAFFQLDTTNVSKLSTAQKNALGSTATDQTNMVNYLLGDTSKDTSNIGGMYRQRDTALGDIVDSQPVYEGVPRPNLFANDTFTGASTYPAFASGKTTRKAVVWVAANDGMVHAFAADDGKELFAFMPGAVMTADIVGATKIGISNLADPQYGQTNPHEYFNDGQLTIADVYLNNSWETVLVGTTGRGPAKAIYALNVTNPANSSLLWERSAGDGGSNSGYIGQIVGAPVVARTPTGSWAVYVGNGYNATNTTAALLQFNLTTGALSAYPTNSTKDNGLAAPSIWIDNVTSNEGTMAYAGDLDGNVWSFDLTSPGSAGKLLFTAKDAKGSRQPITAGMLAGMDPKTQDTWLFFGTGRYLAQADLADKSVQTWYGIIVKPGPSQAQDLTTKLANGRSALHKRSILAEVAPDPKTNPPTLGGRVVSQASGDGIGGDSGWYMNLEAPTGDNGSSAAQGERMVLPNQFQGSLLLGTTRIPVASDPCNPSGAGWIMAINPFTGTNPSSPFFDLNNDSKFTDADKITYQDALDASAGVGFNSVPNAPIFVANTMLTSFDNASTSSINTSGTVGVINRVSWRELISQ